MSIHTQMMRGFVALPVAALLVVAGLVAPTDCGDVVVDVPETTLPRTVDFHSMLPGAIHIVRNAAVATAK